MRDIFLLKSHFWSGLIGSNKFHLFHNFSKWNQKTMFQTICKLAINPARLSLFKQLSVIPTRNLFHRVNHLHDSILSCNWEDHLNFVQNKDLLETENEDLQKEGELLLVHKTTPSLHKKLIEIEQALTCFKQCVFLRDYVMGIIECLKHNETNTLLEEDIQYLSESILKIDETYKILLQKYGFLTSKINQVVQTSLALLLERAPLKKRYPSVSQNI
ncbi:uncharacterized protein LOC128884333 [Hylaeus volcanicus]|uniref:uncharacterized protein LOC128884333 n=1 Tax=Hylaeus volcanicus TaxID=313075 RepID=UPI0023B7771B|nr:uncharacterized protein LOC128884333 [Hylaeus volcanicus]